MKKKRLRSSARFGRWLPLAVFLAIAAAAPGSAASAGSAHEVRFTSSGGIELAGTLWLPEGAGPHPGIAFVQGRSYAYGLPDIAFYVAGELRDLSAVLLIAGIWYPQLVQPASAVVAALVVGALAMHLKVEDPAGKSLPAFLTQPMSAALCALNLP